MGKKRLYIDEVGNADLGASADPNHRYLSLTGVILDLEYVDRILFPELEEIKRRFFGSHPDEPLILHRKELVNQKPPFEALRDEVLREEFNQVILEHLAAWDYRVITVVIDKLQHMEQYTAWRYDPYHYCLKVLLERYVMTLRREGAHGDVMAESRGGGEDKRLKKSFARVVEEGTEWLHAEEIKACLTSVQLKVKPKANNIAGLQLADLIAHPGFKAALRDRSGEPLPDNFGGRIGGILRREKYVRSPSGAMVGWGVKWLP